MFDKLIDLIVSAWNDFKPIIFIFEYKEGIMLRAGKFLKILKPGWHLRIPFVDDFYVENVKTDTMRIKEVTVTTLDSKTVTIGCEFDLRITDIYKAMVDTNDWRSNLQDMCAGVLSDYLEDLHWEDIKRKPTKNAIFKKMEKRAEEMGITISNFNFTDKVVTKPFKLFTDSKGNNFQLYQ